MNWLHNKEQEKENEYQYNQLIKKQTKIDRNSGWRTYREAKQVEQKLTGRSMLK